MGIDLAGVVEKGQVIDGTDNDRLPFEGRTEPRGKEWGKERIAKGVVAEAFIAPVSRVRRDTATLGRGDVKQRKDDLRHISGSTALLLICELFETIGQTKTWHVFHENPLGSHRIFRCAAIKVNLWNRDRCAR
jgi:hypothetical protein